jgi:hypothetical protein
MDPESLSRTLPEVDLAACVPAMCRDYLRSFSVAFPNDGSETDKAYFDPRGGPRRGYFATRFARSGLYRRSVR